MAPPAFPASIPSRAARVPCTVPIRLIPTTRSVLRCGGEKGSDPVPPRVVHPDVQPPELLPDLLSRFQDLRIEGDVGRDLEEPGAGLVPHRGQLLRPLVPDVQY